MAPTISLNPTLYRGAERVFSRPFIKYFSILVISLASSAVSYAQSLTAGAVSNSGSDLPGSVAEVGAAYRPYEAAQASVQAYERGVIARSEQNVQTMRAAYQTGAFRVSELLTEQRRLVDSQRKMTETLAERYHALIDLQAAFGMMTRN